MNYEGDEIAPFGTVVYEDVENVETMNDKEKLVIIYANSDSLSEGTIFSLPKIEE